MSWARRPFASSTLQEKGYASSLVQLILAGSKHSTKVPTQWLCQQCASRIGVRRSLVTDASTSTLAATRKSRKSIGDVASRRYASGEKKAEDGVAEKTELPSVEERRRSSVTKRFASIMDNLQGNIFFAGQRLNDLTGYSGIEKLKQEIQEQEQALRVAQEQLTHAKQSYTAAIQQRSDSQREVNELLQRKNNWSSQDLERFTSLYRSDHANEQAEADAQQELNNAERMSEEAGANLSAKILARYHEEQIWSDKIRRMSTWGTWGLMGVNVLLFLVFQVAVEPWRRRRLVTGFEQKVIEALETQKELSNKATGEALAALQASHVAASRDSPAPAPEFRIEAEAAVEEAIVADVAAETGTDSETLKESLLPATGFQAWLPGLQQHATELETAMSTAFSEEQVTVRRVDLTSRLLEGIFAGVMFTSIFAAIIRGR